MMINWFCRSIMISLALIVLLSINGCTSTPYYRDSLYWATAAVMTGDYYTSWRAIDSGRGEEVGLVGKHTTPTGLYFINLGLLESSRYWKPLYREIFQWSIVITRVPIIYMNWSIYK